MTKGSTKVSPPEVVLLGEALLIARRALAAVEREAMAVRMLAGRVRAHARGEAAAKRYADVLAREPEVRAEARRAGRLRPLSEAEAAEGCGVSLKVYRRAHGKRT